MKKKGDFIVFHKLICVAVCWLSVASFARSDDGQRVIELTDLAGKSQTPLKQTDRKATVLFFMLPDCPISNAYAPEINRIITEYTKKDVAIFIVYVDTDLSADAARKHTMEFGFECPVLVDSRLELVKQTGATIAPEAAVLGADRQLRYRGRIDDLYADYGKRRAQPSQRNLRDALDDVLAGRPVAGERTKAIGCHIDLSSVRSQ